MKDKPLKARDIAEIAGISASDMKRIADNYEQVIPSRLLGRVKIYEQKTAGIVEKISSMEAAGKSTGDIIRELGGKVTRKSTKERTEGQIRKTRSQPGREKKSPSPHAETVKTVPQGSGAARGESDRTAFLELKLNKLTNRVEKLETELQSERDARKQEREEYLKIIAGISENINAAGRWMDYFDKSFDEFSSEQNEFNDRTREWIDYTEEEIDFLKRPFWNKRR